MDKAVEELDKFRSLADIGDVCTLAVTQGLTPPSTCTALNDALSTLSGGGGRSRGGE